MKKKNYGSCGKCEEEKQWHLWKKFKKTEILRNKKFKAKMEFVSRCNSFKKIEETTHDRVAVHVISMEQRALTRVSEKLVTGSFCLFLRWKGISALIPITQK